MTELYYSFSMTSFLPETLDFNESPFFQPSFSISLEETGTYHLKYCFLPTVLLNFFCNFNTMVSIRTLLILMFRALKTYISRALILSMFKTQTQEITSFAHETFSQLRASKVNGFPFFAYTGIKASLFSEESLYLKLPKSPSPFKSILVVYEVAYDTYKVQFYTDDDPLKEKDIHRDVYADQLVDLIVREMGIN